jgi:hypothetical protein
LRANGISFPGRDSCVSTNLRWRVTCTTDSREVHSLKVNSVGDAGEKLLFETGRWCELLWQKEGDLVAITDWEGSDLSSVYIVDLRQPETKRSLANIFPDLHKNLLQEELRGHAYWEALEWETSTILIVRVFGHTDEANGHEFIYKFRMDLKARTYSLLHKENSQECRAERDAWKSKEKQR